MSTHDKTKVITSIVFHAIWIVGAAIFWFLGMSKFLPQKGFEGWMYWGLYSVVPVIIPIFRLIVDMAKSGARDGANEYTATWYGDTLRIQNHPVRGALSGILVGIIAGILIGPIAVVVYAVISVIKILSCISLLREEG